MSNELTLDILDEAIAKIKELKNDIPKEIHINPCDWRKAREAMKKLGELVGMKINVPIDLMWGISVVEAPDLPEGTMLLYYGEDNYVKLEHIGKG